MTKPITDTIHLIIPDSVLCVPVMLGDDPILHLSGGLFGLTKHLVDRKPKGKKLQITITRDSDTPPTLKEDPDVITRIFQREYPDDVEFEFTNFPSWIDDGTLRFFQERFHCSKNNILFASNQPAHQAAFRENNLAHVALDGYGQLEPDVLAAFEVDLPTDTPAHITLWLDIDDTTSMVALTRLLNNERDPTLPPDTPINPEVIGLIKRLQALGHHIHVRAITARASDLCRIKSIARRIQLLRELLDDEVVAQQMQWILELSPESHVADEPMAAVVELLDNLDSELQQMIQAGDVLPLPSDDCLEKARAGLEQIRRHIGMGCEHGKLEARENLLIQLQRSIETLIKWTQHPCSTLAVQAAFKRETGLDLIIDADSFSSFFAHAQPNHYGVVSKHQVLHSLAPSESERDPARFDVYLDDNIGELFRLLAFLQGVKAESAEPLLQALLAGGLVPWSCAADAAAAAGAADTEEKPDTTNLPKIYPVRVLQGSEFRDPAAQAADRFLENFTQKGAARASACRAAFYTLADGFPIIEPEDDDPDVARADVDTDGPPPEMFSPPPPGT
jgi:hypothetical protein